MTESVKQIAMMLLIIGGGGAFKQVLVDGGISDYVSRCSPSQHVSADCRLAGGRSITSLPWLATVASLTAAGLVAPMLAMSSVNPALMVLAVGRIGHRRSCQRRRLLDDQRVFRSFAQGDVPVLDHRHYGNVRNRTGLVLGLSLFTSDKQHPSLWGSNGMPHRLFLSVADRRPIETGTLGPMPETRWDASDRLARRPVHPPVPEFLPEFQQLP